MTLSIYVPQNDPNPQQLLDSTVLSLIGRISEDKFQSSFGIQAVNSMIVSPSPFRDIEFLLRDTSSSDLVVSWQSDIQSHLTDLLREGNLSKTTSISDLVPIFSLRIQKIRFPDENTTSLIIRLSATDDVLSNNVSQLITDWIASSSDFTDQFQVTNVELLPLILVGSSCNNHNFCGISMFCSNTQQGSICNSCDKCSNENSISSSCNICLNMNCGVYVGSNCASPTHEEIEILAWPGEDRWKEAEVSVSDFMVDLINGTVISANQFFDIGMAQLDSNRTTPNSILSFSIMIPLPDNGVHDSSLLASLVQTIEDFILRSEIGYKWQIHSINGKLLSDMQIGAGELFMKSRLSYSLWVLNKINLFISDVVGVLGNETSTESGQQRLLKTIGSNPFEIFPVDSNWLSVRAFEQQGISSLVLLLRLPGIKTSSLLLEILFAELSDSNSDITKTYGISDVVIMPLLNPDFLCNSENDCSSDQFCSLQCLGLHPPELCVAAELGAYDRFNSDNPIQVCEDCSYCNSGIATPSNVSCEARCFDGCTEATYIRGECPSSNRGSIPLTSSLDIINEYVIILF